MTGLYSPTPGRVTRYPDDVPREVCVQFERLALDIAAAGYRRYSADAVLHRIRWHMQIEHRDSSFKANNDWTASLARWFLARHPEHPRFFETRERKAA
ncbi:hypothetical protein RA307_04920 [Xanthobacteraceae bacterium Astr-EGSB]|uniref:hypothetical protein n=1 Tax=Astrobacterium formosum TaxID=3069710 RepID=UPI0027AF460E|nr:hypothetical protein [Xanthobacteraceae bacterium Astr-EGSB]